jgi:hypothetical protein
MKCVDVARKRQPVMLSASSGVSISCSPELAPAHCEAALPPPTAKNGYVDAKPRQTRRTSLDLLIRQAVDIPVSRRVDDEHGTRRPDERDVRSLDGAAGSRAPSATKKRATQERCCADKRRAAER